MPPLKTNVQTLLVKQPEKPKSSIPRINFSKNPQSTQVPNNSSTSNLAASKTAVKTSPPNPPASSRPLSGSSMSSSSRQLSAHSASSSSFKENKKSPIIPKSIPTAIKSTELTNMTNNIVNNGFAPSFSKIKPTTVQCTNSVSSVQSNAILAPSNFLVKPSTASNPSITQTSKINYGVLPEQKLEYQFIIQCIKS